MQQQQEQEAALASREKEDEDGKEPLPQWRSEEAAAPSPPDEAVDINTPPSKTRQIESNAGEEGMTPEDYLAGGVIRTLDGDVAGEEFATDALEYQVLLEKIEALLERLKLDA